MCFVPNCEYFSTICAQGTKRYWTVQRIFRTVSSVNLCLLSTKLLQVITKPPSRSCFWHEQLSVHQIYFRLTWAFSPAARQQQAAKQIHPDLSRCIPPSQAVMSTSHAPIPHRLLVATFPASLCSMICFASFIIVAMISLAGRTSCIRPALSPAIRHISSKSPLVSGVGSSAENFGIGAT